MVSNAWKTELHLPQVDGGTMASLVAAAADLALVVGGDDVILDLSHNLSDGSALRVPAWRGLPIDRVVQGNSRPALNAMLTSARNGTPSKRFEISHRLDGERDLPIQYSALRVGGDGRLILFGRDLRPLADLQSRLLANRRSLEDNDRRQRQSEAHYRLLFETASEAMLVVDAESGRIRDANPRAAAILGGVPSKLCGKKLSAVFDRRRQADVQAMLADVLGSGAPVTLAIGAGAGGTDLSVTAEVFRAGDLKLALVRVSAAGVAIAQDADEARDLGLGDLVRNAAEAILLADDEGRVLWANEAFLTLAGLALAAHAVGRPLGDFLQWNGIEESVILADVRSHGRVARVAGTVKGPNGQSTDVELSVVAGNDESKPGYAFVMRARTEEERGTGRGGSDLTRTAESLVDMIGRVPLKDMIRDTTDVMERMCIEAALKLTGNNRASAARVLGLSRQALYLKMHRFGIDGDPG